jgi:DNA-binding protein H-NS
MASFKEIQDQITQLQRQAAEQRDREFAEAVQTIRHLMQEYDLAVEDLQFVRKKTGVKKPAAVVFRNSETGASWSGRGRMPKWLAGQDKEKYRV